MDENEIRTQLDRIIADPAFSPHGRMAKLLTYVVEEALAGRTKRIKAYSIALSVFERDESFDPQSDSLVRVEAFRLRRQLAAYYETSGKDDPIIIEIPTGRYVPRFKSRFDEPHSVTETNRAGGEAKTAHAAKSSGMRKRRVLLCVVAGLAAILIISGLVYRVLRASNPITDHHISAENFTPPIVDVVPLVNLTEDATTEKLAVGLRMQLTDDLSHFKTLRVRSWRQSDLDDPKSHIKPADYRLSGTLYKDGIVIRVTITIDEVATGYRMWSQTVEVPDNDAGFYGLLAKDARNIVARLASTSGFLQTQVINRLKARSQIYAGTTTSEYQCVLRFHAYDQSKDPTDETYCRTCLELYTNTGSQNSLIWAARSAMLLFDWLASTSPSDRMLLDEALAAAHKAIRLDPTDASAHEVLGSVLMAQNKYDDAYEAYQRSAELNPSNPGVHVLLGWLQVVLGNWEDGMTVVREGIEMSLNPPGWMRIPLSIDAFRRQDYEEALSEAQAMIHSGDKRGVILALAPAIELGKQDLIGTYRQALRADNIADPADPMKEIRNSFNNPDILQQYTETLSRVSLD